MSVVKRAVSFEFQGLRRIQSRIGDWAERKGWFVPGVKRNFGELLMLVNTELSEACEAMREGNPPCPREGMEEFTHVEEELADAVIRILQLGEEYSFDVAGAIEAKMAFNEGRPYKHGKEF